MKTKFILFISLLLIFTACSDKKDTIRIATKPMTEQFILGEMLTLLIENDTDYKVNLTKGIGGGTSNIHPALIKGDFDLYPEYTGTGWLVVLKKEDFSGHEQLYSQLQKEYQNQFDLRWIAPYGFNNTYSLALKNELARENNLTTFSDLANYPDQFSFGAEYDFFEIPMGYRELCDRYNLKFKDTKDMDIGLKYEAIKSGKIDVMNVFTTDGQLSGAGLTVLEDNLGFFPTYYCATVVREDALQRFPGLEATLQKMNNILTNEDMIELNNQVDVQGRNEREVARDFLVRKGLLN